ncbi:MAG: GNAT family N-acetyltransferase [Peptococcaceae bacterium]|nr:GNAT family N-acetyltransferase [Peptococcaceae bacterium]
MEPRLYEEYDAQNLVTLMNVVCQHKRYFVPVNIETINQTLRRGTRKRFGSLIVLGDERLLKGACHVFYDASGQVGHMAYLLSLPGEEGTTWPLLLKAALKHLPRAIKISIGSPYTPLYHAVEGRIQPLWGSTENLEVYSEDTLLIKFLAENGFAPQEHYFTMSKALPAPVCAIGYPFEILRGAECWYNAYSWYGRSSAEEFGLRNAALSVLVQKIGHVVEGHTAWYPLRARARAALCDLEVAATRQGQGLGRALLTHTLEQMELDGYTSCELFISPTQSPHAYALYHSSGFTIEATWYEMVYQINF